MYARTEHPASPEEDGSGNSNMQKSTLTVCIQTLSPAVRYVCPTASAQNQGNWEPSESLEFYMSVLSLFLSTARWKALRD